ncbi:MAG: Txe/YoeB family addiction module toxin [Saprospiraceae bacterium]|nr:Txe/YoeB family addiction module toxin [Saprospiraceae bacterium]
MRVVVYEPNAAEDLEYLASNNLKALKKVIELIHSCRKSPFDGLGKPEPLKHHLKGYWSRRINDEHRLVYKVEDEKITIVSCRDHY